MAGPNQLYLAAPQAWMVVRTAGRATLRIAVPSGPRTRQIPALSGARSP
jgi:hypothetical protein